MVGPGEKAVITRDNNCKRTWSVKSRIPEQREAERYKPVSYTHLDVYKRQMWSSMMFTAIVLIDRWWIRILLFVVSLFVTIHILRIKTGGHEARNSPSRPDSA